MPKTNCFDSLSVCGFKGLSNLELEKLGAINLFLGANDIGKTSVLEAIFLLAGLSNLQLPVNLQSHRNFMVSSFEDLSYFFYGLDVSSPIKLSATSNDLEEERELVISAPSRHATTERPTHRIRGAGNGNKSKGVSGEDSSTRLSSSLASASRALHYDATIKKPSEGGTPSTEGAVTSFSGELMIRSHDQRIEFKPERTLDEMIIPTRILRPSIEYDGQSIAEVIVAKKEKELREILNHINPHIKQIAISGNTAYFDVGLEKMMPLNVFGSGIIRIVRILSLCLVGASKIILIDEIENGLHYEGILPLLKALLVLSSRQGIQIFATTHSLEMLKGLQQVLRMEEYESMQSNTMCHVLAKNKEGVVTSYGYEYSQFEHCIKNGVEIR